jgi:hypothetical protein
MGEHMARVLDAYGEPVAIPRAFGDCLQNKP